LKLKNNPDSTDLSEAIKEYQIPAQHLENGVRVPLSPVVIVDPSSDPARLVPQGWWLYQARRVCTQGVAGPNALAIRINIPAGVVARLGSIYAIGTASAGSTLLCYRQDEDAAQSEYLAVITAGASRELSLPGAAPLGHQSAISSIGYMMGPGSILVFRASVSVAAETLTVAVQFLMSERVEPVWDTTGSGGTPTLAASTISAANTWIKVDLPW